MAGTTVTMCNEHVLKIRTTHSIFYLKRPFNIIQNIHAIIDSMIFTCVCLSIIKNIICLMAFLSKHDTLNSFHSVQSLRIQRFLNIFL